MDVEYTAFLFTPIGIVAISVEAHMSEPGL